ncbi:hypothetical protein AAEX37_01586 [Oligella sp. MSHR50489EDL]|uniref:DUF3540 domain-containing protein n=1 Tax=Oligella sp. MSHR50489EDL TaxID=3139409 RepID=UPI003D816F05
MVDERLNKQQILSCSSKENNIDDLKSLLIKNQANPLLDGSVKAVLQTHAVIKSIESKSVFKVVLGDGTQQYVKRAVSCLHSPGIGDKVLLSGNLDDGFYILALLEVASPETEVVIDFAEQGVIKADKFSIMTNELTVNSSLVSFEFENWKVASDSAQIMSNEMVLKSFSYSQIADQVEVNARVSTFNLKNANRFVTGTDKVHAVNIEYSADILARFEGQVAILNGRELLKTDAKLIMAG